MNFEYENRGATTFLVYKVGENEVIDTMSRGMITNNKIPGIAEAVVTQMNTQQYIKYNISSRVSAKQIFSGVVNRKRLLGVFEGITDAMLSAEDYMIDPNMLIIDLDYIFTDVSTCETVLICLPIIRDCKNNLDLRTFFKRILFDIQFDQNESSDYITKMIDYLNHVSILSLTDFKNLINDLLRGSADAMPKPVSRPKVQTPSQEEKGGDCPVPWGLQLKVPTPAREVIQPKKTAVETPQPTAPSPDVTQPPATPVQIPLWSTEAVPPKAPQQPKQDSQKHISLFYLLQHYNSENAAAYKAQREEKKRKKQGKLEPTAFTVPGAPQQAPTQKEAPAGGVHKYAVPGQSTQTQKETDAPVFQPVSAEPTSSAPQGKPMNFGDTTVLNQGAVSETTVLNQGVIGETTILISTRTAKEQKTEPILIRMQNNEKIAINKPVFRIGKEKSYVDYFVGNNAAVSRSHANIITRDGQYFIVDTNSKNHTFVNGEMIESNVEVKLNVGDTIMLGNEKFEFRIP
jgi:hypothetical protein